MKRRYIGEDDGRLLDRQNRALGTVTIREDGMVLDGERALGRAVSITIDDAGVNLALPPQTPPSPKGDLVSSLGQEQMATNLPLSLLPSSVDEVAAHYMQTMNPRWKQLPPDERKIITEALKVATVDELKTAIEACASSEFHMGRNPQRKKYNALSQIMKGRRESHTTDGRRIPARTTREAIDFFLDLAEKTTHVAGSSSVPSDNPAILSRELEIALDDHAHKISLMLERPVGLNLSDGQGAIATLQRYGLEIELDEARTRVVDIRAVATDNARIAHVQPLLAERLRRTFGLV